MAALEALPEDTHKAESLVVTPADIVNSIDLPLVFVGPELSVLSFNPAAAMLLSLQPADIGRPVYAIRALAGVSNLEDRCEVVVAGGAPNHLEFRNAEGAYFSLAIAAYRSAGNPNTGAILSFTNVTALH